MVEIWKDIPGYEGYYQASNLGRINALNYRHTGKEHLLALSISNRGYQFVQLWKNGVGKGEYVHRLVWSAFNGRIPNGMEINHISECKTDNRLCNLELVTPLQNKRYGTRTDRMAETQTNRKDCSKPVEQYDLNGKFIYCFLSQADAERQTGINKDLIGKVCKNKPHYKTAGGFMWKYKK